MSAFMQNTGRQWVYWAGLGDNLAMSAIPFVGWLLSLLGALLSP
jgi:hypothetical protein